MLVQASAHPPHDVRSLRAARDCPTTSGPTARWPPSCGSSAVRAPLRLLSNNPDKVAALRAAGATVDGTEPLRIRPSVYSQHYLDAKARAGHTVASTAGIDRRRAAGAGGDRRSRAARDGAALRAARRLPAAGARSRRGVVPPARVPRHRDRQRARRPGARVRTATACWSACSARCWLDRFGAAPAALSPGVGRRRDAHRRAVAAASCSSPTPARTSATSRAVAARARRRPRRASRSTSTPTSGRTSSWCAPRSPEAEACRATGGRDRRSSPRGCRSCRTRSPAPRHARCPRSRSAIARCDGSSRRGSAALPHTPRCSSTSSGAPGATPSPYRSRRSSLRRRRRPTTSWSSSRRDCRRTRSWRSTRPSDGGASCSSPPSPTRRGSTRFAPATSPSTRSTARTSSARSSAW